MKVTISYTKEETEEATAIVAALLHRFPDARAKRSERHPPFLHFYLSTSKKPTKAQASMFSAVPPTPLDT